MFAFAGLWERWKGKASGQALETYTVITTDPNELMEPIHNRMPVILAPKTPTYLLHKNLTTIWGSTQSCVVR
jgi:putative SOS response-associated peptidase YedK